MIQESPPAFFQSGRAFFVKSSVTAAASAAVLVKCNEDYAFAAFVGDFMLHIVKSVKVFAVKNRKLFFAHKKHLLAIIIRKNRRKIKGKICVRKNYEHLFEFFRKNG